MLQGVAQHFILLLGFYENAEGSRERRTSCDDPRELHNRTLFRADHCTLMFAEKNRRYVCFADASQAAMQYTCCGTLNSAYRIRIAQHSECLQHIANPRPRCRRTGSSDRAAMGLKRTTL